MPIEKQILDDKTIETITKGGTSSKAVDDKIDVIDKEVHEKAVNAQKSLDGLLEKHGFESVDDVIDALESKSTISKKLGDRDLDAIIKAAETLEGYEAIWAADEIKRQNADDTDEGRISRLEKELQSFRDEKKSEKDKERAAKESKDAIDAYEEIATSISKENDIPEGQIPFFKEFMGINNPILDVDLDDKIAVRKMVKDQTKKYNSFVNGIIKSYTEGKIKLVDIKPADPVVPDKPQAKNLKEARNMAKDRILGFFNKS